MKTLDLPEEWRGRAIVIGEAPAGTWFDDEELETASAFRLPKRREEWMHARIAAKHLAISRGIADDAREIRVERPVLRVAGSPTPWHVSISHSGPYAAAALDLDPVGIDVEVVREISERAAHFFLTESEEAAAREVSLAHRLLHFWSAKEAAWKQRGRAILTLRQVPLTLERATDDGLYFDLVETRRIGDAVVALTRARALNGRRA